ncbi:MAG: hypothetical protein HY812_20765 [Planctomycetes bacterium]|nr:hypothetical protein [Planctomycetota bacterium]
MNPRIALAACLLALAAAGCLGRAGVDLELGAPSLEVKLALDAATYGVGAAVLAEVTITNVGEAPVTVGRPSSHTVDFFIQPEGAPEPRHTQQVASPVEAPAFVVIEPGESHARVIPLNFATSAPGSYRLFAVYGAEPQEGVELTATLASNAAPITVTLPVVLERDAVGLITEQEARRIALEHFGGEAQRIEARLVQDERFRTFVWWVTVYQDSPARPGRAGKSCFVDAFLGHVRAETEKAVPPPEEAHPPGG